MTCYKHKKTGGLYELVAIGKMQTATWTNQSRPDKGPLSGFHDSESVDMREVAIYRSLEDGKHWVRPREEFEDGRFEIEKSKAKIDIEAWDNTTEVSERASLDRKTRGIT